MSLDLTGMVTTKMENKTFRLKLEEDIGNIDVMEDDEEGEVLMELTLEYRSPRKYREMLSETVSRKAVSKKGIKAMVSDEERARQLICNRLIKGWVMDCDAAFALEFAADISDKPGDEEIPFTPANLKQLSENSSLPAVVNAIMTDHEKWFEAPGGGEKSEDDVPN